MPEKRAAEPSHKPVWASPPTLMLASPVTAFLRAKYKVWPRNTPVMSPRPVAKAKAASVPAREGETWRWGNGMHELEITEEMACRILIPARPC